MSFGREYSEESKPTSLCSVCGAKILPKKIFCFECGPPDPLKKEPEETGISLEQAVVRIAGLVFLFVCVALVKFYVSTDDFSLADKDREVQSSINGKKIQDDAFELIHTVIPSSANVRSKPSIDGRVIAIVEEGMNLNPIEKKEGWTKIRVFEKTGWIASRLIKSEVQAIK
jgi:hypothetical protein|tara:strand:- start:288 stop:800 length:513 start_codon:yes stop_codon:yes gene_type:complete